LIGTTINHYKILEKLGAGGMGEVFVAEDTKLNRRVALKVLPPEMAANAERLGRFEREARAVAALDHPNIVTIHSIEESDSDGTPVHFLTMELVEGKPLTQVIPKGGFDLGRLVDIALAMAAAMTAAHDKGITHRDLKPDNIMIGDDGRVRILDFGLAKLMEEPGSAGEGSELATRGLQTEDGRILGTVAYMAPEQAEGKPVDSRTDVFAMGILLYEMATGTRPFKGDTRISVLSSIMRDTPESVTSLNQELPRHVGRVIKRCLAKDPDRRYGNARELHNELLELKEEIASGELLPGTALLAPARRGSRFWPGVAAPGVGPVAPAPLQTSVAQITHRAAPEYDPSLSPDGRTVLYMSAAAGNSDIYLQRVDGGNVINLTTDSPAPDYFPAFSPDGERIAFRSERDGGGIFVMGAMGGSVARITEAGFNPAWSADGSEILYATEGAFDPRSRSDVSRLMAVDVATRESRVVFEGDAVQPSASPGGHRIAFWGLRLGSGQRDIWTIPAEGGEPVPVTADAATDWNPVWSPDGVFLYFNSDRGGQFNLWRVPIDEATGEVLGDPQAVTAGAKRIANMSISADGRRIAYSAVDRSNNLQRLTLDPEAGTVLGEPAWVTQGSNAIYSADLSLDGEWIALVLDAAQEDILIERIDGTGRRQLTDDPHKDRGPRWSPDGKRIAFYSDRSGSYEIWTIQPDGRGLRRLTDTPGEDPHAVVWSSDGKRLGFHHDEAFRILDPEATWETQAPEALPAWDGDLGYFFVDGWSPDGKYLAGNFFSRTSVKVTNMTFEGFGLYSLETGEYERLLEKDAFSGEPSGRWLSDSRRLLLEDDGKIYVLDRETGEHRKIYEEEDDTIDLIRLSVDERTLYWMRRSEAADIWMLELDG